MTSFKNLFRKASLTLVDGLLLVLCAASLAYLSVPFIAKSGAALGNAVDTHGDIRVVGVIVFLGILFLRVVGVFCATFVTGCLILVMLPGHARLFRRVGLMVVFLQSATFPPSPSDEEMNLPPREARLFLFREAHENSGSNRECGFDDYAVWGWDEKGAPPVLRPEGASLLGDASRIGGACGTRHLERP